MGDDYCIIFDLNGIRCNFFQFIQRIQNDCGIASSDTGGFRIGTLIDVLMEVKVVDITGGIVKHDHRKRGLEGVLDLLGESAVPVSGNDTAADGVTVVGNIADKGNKSSALLYRKDTDGAEIYRVFSKVVMFTTIDDAWREHLREMDELRHSVQNASYEQKDPLLIYKFESFGLFEKMLQKVNREVVSILCKAYIPVQQQNQESLERARQNKAKVDVNKLQASRMAAAAAAGQGDKSKPAPIQVEKKVGRNEPCPCGSGKKYKHCHGR